jgi:DNA repair exonuclease SbcCD nuclease subunit
MHRFDEKYLQITSDFLLMHQTPLQIDNKIIPHDIDLTNNVFSNFHYIFSGHIHKHQILIKDKAVMVGSPLHRDAGDEGQDKGFIIFDTSLNTFERIILDKYPKFTYNVDVSDDYVLATKDKSVVTGAKIKIKSPIQIITDFVDIKKADKNILNTGINYLNEL